jgi:hypothetical protein
MASKVLITFDLVGAGLDQRRDFENYIKQKGIEWEKIDNLSTAWKASVNLSQRKEIIKFIKETIEGAKKISFVPEVYFAFQIANEKVEIDHI